MHKSLLIIGGGFAGVSAALGAARQRYLLKANIEILLVSDHDHLTIRPRLYEYELEQTQVSLKKVLQPIDVNIEIDRIDSIDFKNCFAIGQNNQYSFDTMILAAGSRLIHPSIPGLIEFSHNIDNFDSAKQYRQALINLLKHTKPNQSYHIVILGGGLTGIECATELPVTIEKICQEYQLKKPSIEIVLIDRHNISCNLGENPKLIISNALKYCGIKCLDHRTILEIKHDQVILNNQTISADLIISTLGIIANPLTQQLPFEKDHLGRMHVNNYLQILGQPHYFAAGDIAVTKVDTEHQSIMSCQQARPQGRYAGYNAIAKLSNTPLLNYTQPNYVTCVDLGNYGALYTEGWNRIVKKTGKTAKEIKQHINRERIYPAHPMTLEKLMNEGSPEFITPINSLSPTHG